MHSSHIANPYERTRGFRVRIGVARRYCRQNQQRFADVSPWLYGAKKGRFTAVVNRTWRYSTVLYHTVNLYHSGSCVNRERAQSGILRQSILTGTRGTFDFAKCSGICSG